MSLVGAPTPCSPRPLLPRVAGSAGYTAVVKLSAPVLALRGDQLYQELDLTKDSWPAKRLIFGDQAVRVEAIREDRTVLKAKLDAEKREKRALARKEAKEAENLAAKLPALNFQATSTPGRLCIGDRPKNKTVQKTVPEDSPQIREGAVAQTSRKDSSRKGRQTVPPPSTRRTPGKQYERVSPAAYVDVYVRKFKPPRLCIVVELPN